MAKEKENFPRREERVAYGNRGKTKETGKSKKETPTKQKRHKPAGNPKLPKKQALLCGIGLILLIIIFVFVRKNGTEVFVNGESVGVLEGSKVTAQAITETIETQLAGIVGSKVKLNEAITAEGIHIGGSRKKDICTMEHLIPKIRNMVTYKVDAAIIMVDGGKAAVLATEAQANAVLDGIKAPYLPAEGIEATVSWVENVTVAKDFVDSEEILTEEAAAKLLQATTTVTGSYTVKSGDALYKIAQNNDTSVEEILKLNEGMTINTPVRVGQLLNIPVQKPKISVKTVETQVLTTVEPKAYQYQSDHTQPKSYQKVVQQGRAGQKKSTIQITRVNGFVEEEKEVSKEIITEAVPEIIVRGTL